ncbi:MAG: MarC family protein [Arenicella sp.]
MTLFSGLFLKLFFLFTPFSALTLFLIMTKGFASQERNRVALRVAFSISVISTVLLFFGNTLFTLLGITLDAFRVGAGTLLFLSAVNLAQSKTQVTPTEDSQDIAVVPLAIPIIVGPATIGTLMVLGSERESLSQTLITLTALLAAIVCVWLVLRSGPAIEARLGARGINILSKISGLILAAIAAQMVLSGVASFLQ